MVKRDHWNDLRAQSNGGDIPTWHRDVLAERLWRLDSGIEPISAWSEAKERICARIRAGGLAEPAPMSKPTQRTE